MTHCALKKVTYKHPENRSVSDFALILANNTLFRLIAHSIIDLLESESNFHLSFWADM